MVTGIESFKEWFREYKDHYVIIGGTACDILMAEAKNKFCKSWKIYIEKRIYQSSSNYIDKIAGFLEFPPETILSWVGKS